MLQLTSPITAVAAAAVFHPLFHTFCMKCRTTKKYPLCQYYSSGSSGADIGGRVKRTRTRSRTGTAASVCVCMRECAKFYSNLKEDEKEFHQFNQYYTTHSNAHRYRVARDTDTFPHTHTLGVSDRTRCLMDSSAALPCSNFIYDLMRCCR